MNTRNSTKVVWIDTRGHRCTQMEEDIAYPLPTRTQGRDATNPVPSISMFAGKPEEFDDADRDMRATAWKILAVLLIAFWCAFVISALQVAQ